MKKQRLLMACMSLAVMTAVNAEIDIADQYFSKKEIRLTKQESAAIAIGKKWQTGMATSKPVTAKDGSIAFVYGSGQTQILCAVLQVCDVALQPGEQINNLEVGDPRFLLDPAVTGFGPLQRLHVLIKALDVGLDTSLVITTDRRTYHLRLRSSRHTFMPYVSFIYPDEVQAKWNAVRLKETMERHNNTLPQTGEYLGDLNFNYCITGKARWKPIRVFNDGIKTIIEMPKAMKQTEAPTLLVLRHGGLFKKAETVMVNYRVQNNRYIVDTVFDKAILIVGVGRNQDKVTLVREKK
ncbi:MAG: P-type conjugative transfer protein TrbG [Tatlockia sp.]|nr:P-type conjugative transfer protein TrbG [Tatlockia sp.]